MSVDYDAVYGIGFEIDREKYDEDDLDGLLSGNADYEHKTSGNYFTGDDLKSYVFIKKDLNDIALDVSNEKLKLESYLRQIDVDVVSNFGLHGGSLVW